MSENTFIKAAEEESAVTLSENGALKFTTTGMPFVDQFGSIGSYREQRSIEVIKKDCDTLWQIDRSLAVKFILYLRMITRKTRLLNGTTTSVSQKGAEMRYEGIMRMLWLYQTDVAMFWEYIDLFVAIGSWKDIFLMLAHDLEKGWDGRKLDWDRFGVFILSALKDPNQTNLVKKYLPHIKSAKHTKKSTVMANDTIIAKWLCSLLFGAKNKGKESYKKYRLLKVSGTAHEWQQLISQEKYSFIDFDKIPGRALHLLVAGKFLKNQGLTDTYKQWVGESKEIKFTGFVHELFGKLPKLSELRDEQKTTVNKQFETLVAKGEGGKQSKLIVVRDTSGSMGSMALGTKITCYNIAKALALYFSAFLQGTFANKWIEFNSTAKMHTWTGKTPVDKWYNDHTSFVGSTNFQSVIELFCTIKAKGADENDFPTGILCISDGEFNPADLGETNVQTAHKKLRAAGFSKAYINDFVICLWNLQRPRGGDKFETRGNVKNVYYFSGYSASVISFLTGNGGSVEVFLRAMDQEVLNLVK